MSEYWNGFLVGVFFCFTWMYLLGMRFQKEGKAMAEIEIDRKSVV